ncbi:S24 family peptidase [Halodurantibacterium flavum]|uniref:Helix-turn-helix transcriptional regulator n=1 Tax=Halodurantibacterium flavum TaxID=1382802 RepID=A0ABW4SB25_9RHOB
MANYLANWPDKVKAKWPVDMDNRRYQYGHMQKQTFRQQMIDALDRAGMSVAELSRRSGVSYDAINKLKRRPNASTSAENAAALAEALGIEWDQGSGVIEIATKEGEPENVHLVPVYGVAASAGFGAIVDEESPVSSLAFPPAYLKRLTSSSPAHLAIISVKGDSMEPTLLDDDVVLIDTSKTSLAHDGLFVFRYDDALQVKRVGRAARRGYVTILSDNRTLYPIFEAAIQDLTVVGKVLWYGRKV